MREFTQDRGRMRKKPRSSRSSREFLRRPGLAWNLDSKFQPTQGAPNMLRLWDLPAVGPLLQPTDSAEEAKKQVGWRRLCPDDLQRREEAPAIPRDIRSCEDIPRMSAGRPNGLRTSSKTPTAVRPFCSHRGQRIPTKHRSNGRLARGVPGFSHPAAELM